MKIFKQQNVIDACVLGHENGTYELLEYLVKNTCIIFDKLAKVDPSKKLKYDLKNLKRAADKDYWWKSRFFKKKKRKKKLHFVFEIPEVQKRNQYLKLLMDHDIGDVLKRNKMGFLP